MEFMSVIIVTLAFALFVYLGTQGADLTFKRNPTLAVNLSGYAYPIWAIWAAVECVIEAKKKVSETIANQV